MRVSVVICTRNRGSLIEATLCSVVSGTMLPDEILVIDQSDSDTTKVCVEGLARSFPGIRYVATETRGLSRARNLGVTAAVGELIVFTDDDVVVHADWLACVVAEFQAYPDLGLCFGTVLPPDGYDWRSEHVPYSVLSTKRPVGWSARGAYLGIGANMALRRSTFNRIGPFDEQIGAGTPYAGFEDTEYTLRALCGTPVVPVHHLNEATLVHHAGARSGAERLRFVRSMHGKGKGMFWAYCIRKHPAPRYFYVLAQVYVTDIREFLAAMLRGRKPTGILTSLYCFASFVRFVVLPPIPKV